MSAALSIALAMEAQGKNSVFLNRGRVVTFEEIKHYFRRKGIHDLQAMAAGRTASESESLITCYTPPATPQPSDTIGSEFVDAAEVDQLLPEGYFEEDFKLIDTAGSVPPSGRTTQRIPALRHLAVPADCLDCVFEDPHWMEQESAFELDTLELFYHYMTDGWAFLDAAMALGRSRCSTAPSISFATS